jgi:hypothetical protein
MLAIGDNYMHNVLMELTDLLSTVEAAAQIGVTPVTLRHWVADGRVVPVALGQRQHADGRTSPHGLVFTRRMVDELADGSDYVCATDDEISEVFNTERAAAFLGVSSEVVRQAYHVYNTLPGRKVGNNSVFLLADLLAYQDRERGPASGPDHPRALFTAEQVREMRRLHNDGLTLREIAEQMQLGDADMTTIWGVIDGRTYKHV